MEPRKQRGLAIAAVCKIVQTNGQWIVPSQSGNGHYRVNLNPKPFVPMCTCPDYEERKEPCKHVFAVQFVVQRETHPDGSETVTETLTVSQTTTAERPTYRQDWPAYNAAQTNEKAKLQGLLSDLCWGLPRTERKPGSGRDPVPMADLAFAAAFKVYSTVSGRRFQTDLDDAHANGHTSRAIRYNTVFDAFERPDMTPVLKTLIAESALPLRSVEVDFAVDSSGFSTSRLVRWIDHKYGCPRQEYDWVKVSIITGVKTNIVTAVEVDEKKGGDSPQFAPLVKRTAGRFKIREVSADKAYSSYDNAELVAQLGGTPYIAMPSSTTGQRGGTLAKMFHFYNYHREEYLSHYHKRSNVETTFSMVKAKFGDHLRSKTDTAMINESLCKILCHNLCCVIQSVYELGIEAKFGRKRQRWDERSAEDTTRSAERSRSETT